MKSLFVLVAIVLFFAFTGSAVAMDWTTAAGSIKTGVEGVGADLITIGTAVMLILVGLFAYRKISNMPKKS